jgi:hypothetical protein
MPGQEVSFSTICVSCNNTLRKSVQPIAPELFAADKEPTMISSFWCPRCGEPLVIKLRFFRNELGEVNVRVEEKMLPTAAFVPNPGVQGITVRCKASKKIFNKNE